MSNLTIKKQHCVLISDTGLVLITKYPQSIKFSSLVDSAYPVHAGEVNSCHLKPYLDLLCLRKSNFDAIENFRDNAFFKRTLGLMRVHSSPTLRQHLEQAHFSCLAGTAVPPRSVPRPSHQPLTLAPTSRRR